jgi:tetratricopeptide (TPR) repeat protein
LGRPIFILAGDVDMGSSMESSVIPGSPETFSLFGESLYRRPIRLWLPADEEAYRAKLRQLEEDHEKSLIEYAEDPYDPERIIWLGRHTGILGRFMEAVTIYSRGIEKFPTDPRFPRYRGHRFAILRRLDLAIADLEMAARLIEGRPDEPEFYASGGPSDDKLGVSSFNWNVWYHLGFTYFTAGRFGDSVRAYRRCMEATDNLESVVATSHWLYMALLRHGDTSWAAELLEGIESELEMVEVGDYYETLLMYKGESAPEALLAKARSEGPVRFITRAQAVANLYISGGETEKALEVFRDILGTGEWSAGVHLIAESELKRLGESSKKK